jgi:hypothetical protein
MIFKTHRTLDYYLRSIQYVSHFPLHLPIGKRIYPSLQKSLQKYMMLALAALAVS